MAKTTEKSDVLKKLARAKSIREEAEKQAKEIESGILVELKEEKKKLLQQVKEIDGEIERISGKSVSADGVKKRIDTEQTILEIVKDAGKISCIDIEKHPKMIALYSASGREVSSQAVKLASLLKDKKLEKIGERKKALYSLPKS